MLGMFFGGDTVYVSHWLNFNKNNAGSKYLTLVSNW